MTSHGRTQPGQWEGLLCIQLERMRFGVCDRSSMPHAETSAAVIWGQDGCQTGRWQQEGQKQCRAWYIACHSLLQISSVGADDCPVETVQEECESVGEGAACDVRRMLWHILFASCKHPSDPEAHVYRRYFVGQSGMRIQSLLACDVGDTHCMHAQLQPYS